MFPTWLMGRLLGILNKERKMGTGKGNFQRLEVWGCGICVFQGAAEPPIRSYGKTPKPDL